MKSAGGLSMTMFIFTGLGGAGDLPPSLPCLSLESDRSLSFLSCELCFLPSPMRPGRLMCSMLVRRTSATLSRLLFLAATASSCGDALLKSMPKILLGIVTKKRATLGLECGLRSVFRGAEKRVDPRGGDRSPFKCRTGVDGNHDDGDDAAEGRKGEEACCCVGEAR